VLENPELGIPIAEQIVEDLDGAVGLTP